MNILHEYSDVADHVTLSMGIATMTPASETESHSRIVAEADQLLYAAKKTGRNKFILKDFTRSLDLESHFSKDCQDNF